MPDEKEVTEDVQPTGDSVDAEGVEVGTQESTEGGEVDRPEVEGNESEGETEAESPEGGETQTPLPVLDPDLVFITLEDFDF